MELSEHKWLISQIQFAPKYYRDRGGHFKVIGLKPLANIKKHSGRCFAIYLAFARRQYTTSTNITKTSTRVILSNIANMLNKPPEVATF